EPPPRLAEMLWLVQNSTVAHRRWKSPRDQVELPLVDLFFDVCDHFPRRQSRSGFEFSFLLARNHQLYVCAADVDDQDFFSHERIGGSGATVIGINLSAVGAFLLPSCLAR